MRRDVRRLAGDYLQIDRKTVAFDRTSPHWLDVAELRHALTPGQLPVDLATRQAAVDLYRGDFLSGFTVHNAPAFEAWVLEQREQIHILVMEALFALVNEHVQQADFVAALAANRRLLLLEPWSEPAHRQQMLILARMGDRRAALAQFETCRRILATEFGIEPLAETTALSAQIQAGQIGEEKDDGRGKTVTGSQALGRSQPTEIEREDEQSGSELRTIDEAQTMNDAPQSQVIGHNLPPRTRLYGRQSELAQVRKWVVEDGCRAVGIFGIGGQGKTALAATLVRDLAEAASQSGEELGKHNDGVFHPIIWQSLLNAPPMAEVLQEWLYILSGQTVTSRPASLDQQFSQLLNQLRDRRALLILDNLESILIGDRGSGDRGSGDKGSGDKGSGDYRAGYEAYGQLIHLLATGEHRSCLLFTSRERPRNLTHLEEDTSAVRFLPLAGLPDDAGRQMMAARGVAGDPANLADLVQHYSGNPLALKLAAETIDNLFDGDIPSFLRADTRIFGDIRNVLDQQFARLDPLERELLIWLAIAREPVSYAVLRDLLAKPPAPRLVLEAMRSLQRRSLLENYDDGFGLQNVVLEYTTDLLVENVGRELRDDKNKITTGRTGQDHPLTSYLNRYALILAQTKEYVRASQARLLLEPVAERLVAQLGERGAEQLLQNVLADMRAVLPKPGYAAANLLHLLLQLGVDPHEMDFSRLHLRQLYLRGVDLPQANFARAEIIDSVFTEPFGLIYATVFSPDGQYLAAGTSEGAIYIWRAADQQLAQLIQAHTQPILTLAFTQHTTAFGDTELLLASASDDATVGIWSLATGEQAHQQTRFAHKPQTPLISVGFQSGDQRVTSVDGDGRVFLWEITPKQQRRPIQQFVALPTRWRLVAYSEDGQIMAVGNRAGTVQIWRQAAKKMVMGLTVEAGPILSLALSADGKTLATGDSEGRLCLWGMATGKLHQKCNITPTSIDALAFSPNGKALASTHGVGDHAPAIPNMRE